MAALAKFAIFMFFARTCKLYEMYTEYSKNTVLHFDQFWDNCPGFEQNNTLQLNYLRAHGNRSNMLFDYETRITRDLPKITAIVILEKCTSKEAPDTCMKLAPLRTNRICAMLESKHDFWSPSIQCTEPKLDCHLKKGIYKGTDCSLRMSDFKFFPLSSNIYWKTKVLFVAKGGREILNCMRFSAKLENKKR